MSRNHPPEVVDRIRELWGNPQQTTVMIGKVVGLNDESVRKVAIRRRRTEGLDIWPIKASHPPYHPEIVETVKRLWRKRESTSFIAAEVGLTNNMVIGIVYRGREREGEAAWPTKGSGWQNSNYGGWWTRKPRSARKARPAPEWRPKPQTTLLTPAEPLPAIGLVTFALSKRGQCKFPMWDDNQPWKPNHTETVMVCGRPVEGEGSWCPAHRRLCFDARRTAASSRPFRHKALELA